MADESAAAERQTTQAKQTSPAASAIEFSGFYGDGSFLKLLQETLQKNASVLQKGTVKLALSPVAIAYLNDRLHSTLCPKKAADYSGRIDGWTIRERPRTEPFRHVLSPKTSDIFKDADTVPIGHLGVLKLSTLLTEVTYLKVTTGAEPLPTSLKVHFILFPNLNRIELRTLPAESLEQLACFVNQLEILQAAECTLDSPHTLLHHGTWTQLAALKLTKCQIEEWSPRDMLLAPSLKHLDCSHNKLERLEDFPSPLTLETANFGYNQLKQLNLQHSFLVLKRLTLRHNRLDSIQALPWSHMPNLKHLDLSYNELDDLSSVDVLDQLKQLESLLLQGNPLAKYPDYRRQVLFYLGEKVELDEMEWSWTEMDSMRFSRHYKGTKGPLDYPYLAPKPAQLQARVVKIYEPNVLDIAANKKPRTQSAFSEVSVASTRSRSATSEHEEVVPKDRSSSYHVDEFLRDLADEESPEEHPPSESENIRPPSTPGVPMTIFLSMDQAESLDLPLSREGIAGLVHVTPTKLLEYFPGGAIVQRYRANLLCMALFTSESSQMTIQLGFRNRPTVAYKVSDKSAVEPIIRAMHESLTEKCIIAFKCKACSALVVSREKRRPNPSGEPFVLSVHRCWVCNSSNGREFAGGKILQCYIDLGLHVVETQPNKPRVLETNQQGFIFEVEYDEIAVRDEVIWIVTDTSMKEMKVNAVDGEDDIHADMAKYRQLCGF
ncbi:hypothetical protein Ae201684P_012530 [Aphanomyces euteiches]|nr:hypothetical protein Ae201684P_012530 [Aphanomyces euteiches]KAH9155125.1 hypothetical protein AeRB84_002881 [Aphanomyces euteiches]